MWLVGWTRVKLFVVRRAREREVAWFAQDDMWHAIVCFFFFKQKTAYEITR